MAKKIKIFVDGEVLVAPHFSGIGHYTLGLLKALDDLITDKPNVVVELGVYFKRTPEIRKFGFNNFRIRKTYLPLRITNKLKIEGIQFYYDLLFGKRIYLFPNYTSWPLLRSKSIPIVYDLSFEYFPHYVEPNNQKFLSANVRKSVEWASRVVTISKNSQEEISEFYKFPKDKIQIIYPGIDQSVYFRYPSDAVAKVKAKYAIHGKYILFVGNIEPRKNLKNLLLAYEKLPIKIRNEYSLLLVGARGWLDDEIFAIIERLRIAGSIIQQPQGYVHDEDIAAIYSGASLFVYPSQYEGFGIPPVEAMACGVPVITSDNSSLPEAVGKAAITVPADSVTKLSSAIHNVIEDEKLQKTMIENGYKQADKYRWYPEAMKLLDLFTKVSDE